MSYLHGGGMARRVADMFDVFGWQRAGGAQATRWRPAMLRRTLGRVGALQGDGLGPEAAEAHGELRGRLRHIWHVAVRLLRLFFAGAGNQHAETEGCIDNRMWRTWW